MATASVTYVFANGTNADGTQVNANFTSLLNFINTEVIQRDASVAFTAIPTLPATTPTLDNHAVRKAYVDAFIPAGVITQFGGSVAPSGWLLCDGAEVSRTNPTYTRLFAAISTTYGAGDGTTTFNVPNLKGRIPVGYDATQTEFDTLAETGGAKTVALTTAQLASHTHGVGTYAIGTVGDHTHANTFAIGTNGDHFHTADGTLSAAANGGHSHDANDVPSVGFVKRVSGYTTNYVIPYDTNNDGIGDGISTSNGGMAATFEYYTNNVADHIHDVTGNTSNAGSHTHSLAGGISNGGSHSHTLSGASLATGEGQAHNNLQPYVVVNYIVKL